MKEKILKLIHSELNNVGIENIFHDCLGQNLGWNYGWWCSSYKPFSSVSLDIKKGVNILEQITVDLLDFTLKFEDGEPIINVYTIKHISKEINEIYKTKYFGLKKYTQKIYTHEITTKVTCGHITFDLSDEERFELIELTKVSYAKHILLKNAARDEEFNKKINKRLKKYKN